MGLVVLTVDVKGVDCLMGMSEGRLSDGGLRDSSESDLTGRGGGEGALAEARLRFKLIVPPAFDISLILGS